MHILKEYTPEEVKQIIDRWTENTVKDNPEIMEKSPLDILLEKEAIKRIYLQHFLDINELYL